MLSPKHCSVPGHKIDSALKMHPCCVSRAQSAQTYIVIFIDIMSSKAFARLISASLALNCLQVRLLGEHTDHEPEEIEKTISRPKYFDPYEAVKYGIIDRVSHQHLLFIRCSSTYDKSPAACVFCVMCCVSCRVMHATHDSWEYACHVMHA